MSGSAVTLTLATPVSAGESVTVAYTSPTGETESRLQDLAGNAAGPFSGQDVANNTPAARPNTPAAGRPAISGTARVGETLAVDTSGISDADGLANAVFTNQWTANDGSSDADILDATGSSYTPVAADVGKTIRVAVSFTGDAGHAETLISAATAAVVAAVAGSPDGLAVLVSDSGKLGLTWNAPGSDGGSAITGYRVQWKETAGNWDTPADVSEITVTVTSQRVSDLTDGTEYTFRVVAINAAGDSAPSREKRGAPRDATPPTLSSASLNGATLTITFDEALDANQTPDQSAFAVTVAGNDRGVDIVEVSGSAVTLTLVTAVFAGDAATVAYTTPSCQSEAKLKDLAGTAVSSFSGRQAANNTPAADRLTASVLSAPESHDGHFTFELRLSEEPRTGFSYKPPRDHAFTVTGGEVT